MLLLGPSTMRPLHCWALDVALLLVGLLLLAGKSSTEDVEIEVILPSLFLGVNVTLEDGMEQCPDEWETLLLCLVLDCPDFVDVCPVVLFGEIATGGIPDCIQAQKNYCFLFDCTDCCVPVCEDEVFDLASCAAKALGGDGYQACNTPVDCNALEEDTPVLDDSITALFQGVDAPMFFLGVNASATLAEQECPGEWNSVLSCTVHFCPNFLEECNEFNAGAAGTIPSCDQLIQNYCSFAGDCCMSECQTELLDLSSCAAVALGSTGHQNCSATTATTNCSSYSNEAMPACVGSPMACEDLFETVSCSTDCNTAIAQCASSCSSASSACECSTSNECNIPGLNPCKEVSCAGEIPPCEEQSTEDDCHQVPGCSWNSMSESGGGDDEIAYIYLPDINASLPDYTVEAISDPSTPQSVALDWLTGHPDLTSMPEWRKHQLFALVTMYEALDGDLWGVSASRNFLSYEEEECSSRSFHSGWGGPLNQCNGNGEIRYLTLRNLGLYGLNGTMPNELALLSSLESLSYDNNRGHGGELADLTPTTLKDLQRLTKLEIHHVDLVGSVQTEIGELSQLRNIAIGFNGLSGNLPSEVGLMTSLTLLNTLGNTLTGTIPTWIGLLTSLRRLLLGDNLLTGAVPSELARLSNLRSLDIDGNLITAIPPEVCSLPALLQTSVSYDGVWVDCTMIQCPESCNCNCGSP